MAGQSLPFTYGLASGDRKLPLRAFAVSSVLVSQEHSWLDHYPHLQVLQV